jgi:hypothetical protein
METALDPETGRILIAYVADDGVFLVSRASLKDPWEGPTNLDPSLPKNVEDYQKGSVWIKSTGKDRFVINADYGTMREWEVTLAGK